MFSLLKLISKTYQRLWLHGGSGSYPMSHVAVWWEYILNGTKLKIQKIMIRKRKNLKKFDYFHDSKNTENALLYTLLSGLKIAPVKQPVRGVVKPSPVHSLVQSLCGSVSCDVSFLHGVYTWCYNFMHDHTQCLVSYSRTIPPLHSSIYAFMPLIPQTPTSIKGLKS